MKNECVPVSLALPMAGTHPLPILISSKGDPDILLERVPLTGGSGNYGEDWLQNLLYKHPKSLPIAEINPSFTGLIPICREMSTPAGPIDVLYATREGHLVILEAKLWRNPEARRKVIGQILDYAKELSHWSYETLDAAVRASRRREHCVSLSLFDVVSEQNAGLDEAQFIDAVSRRLRLGELLLLIAGDGIRENLKAITSFIEDHGTLHFTFGLVEMAIFLMPDGMHLVQPRVIAHSEVIRRIVVDLRGDRLNEHDSDADSARDESETIPRPDLEEQRTKYREFWREWMEKYPLDDKSQPVRNPAARENQFFDMPGESRGRMSAVAADKSGQVGIYLSFPRQPGCDAIFDAFLAEKATIESEVEQELKWDRNDKNQVVHVWKKFGARLFPEHRQEAQKWLGDVVNRFVNTFRPRIDAALRNQ